MKTSFLLVLCFVFAKAEIESYIEGGNLADDFAHPYLVSIQFRFPPNFLHVCGGVILSPRWVLTANGCFEPSIMTEVLSGKFDLQIYETGQQRRGVAARNTAISSDGNLIMINLASDFIFDERTNETTFIDSDRLGQPGDVIRLIGWPYVDRPTDEVQVQALRVADFSIVDNNECDGILGRPLNPRTEFCTGPTDGTRAACHGNLGAPVFLAGNPGEVLGVLVNFPINCRSTEHYSGIYARVSGYRRWIDMTMQSD